MRGPFSLIRRFRSDERGAFAMIFAVLAIVLVATSGAVVDFTSMQQARTRAQVALDAAALALQPKIYTYTTTQLKNSAQTLVTDRLDDNRSPSWSKCSASGALVPPCVNVDTAAVNTNDGTLTFQAQLSVPMYFVSLVGFPQLNFRIESQATRKKLNLEVAMVLDNSGSMNDTMGYNSHVSSTLPTRMDTLKSSATCAVNILFYGVKDCSTSTTGLTANANVKMAVIPFTSEVNVGTSNANASWLDRSGNWTGSVADDNFDSNDIDSDIFTGTVDRVSLFSGMTRSGTALSWGGCVEARLEPYDTNDAAPVTGTNTMFTPYFAPDEPDNGGYSNNYISDTPNSCPIVPTCVQVMVKTNCTSTNYDNCGSSPSTTITYNQANRTVTHPASCPATGSPHSTTSDSSVQTSSIDGLHYPGGSGFGEATIEPAAFSPGHSSFATAPSLAADSADQMDLGVEYASCWNCGGGGTSHTYKLTRTITYTYSPYAFDDRVLQERLCKYTGAALTQAPSRSNAIGPNGDCPATAIQPLTSTPATVLSAVNAMSPGGATNIHAGTVWGWRVLSPDAPFTEGGAYDQANSKVLIVMTDGENTAYPTNNMNGTYIYQAFGYPYDNKGTVGGNAHVRLGTVGDSATTLEGDVNDRLKTTCDNAKALGITVYTIGVDPDDTSDPTGNRALLTYCASTSQKAYFPTTAQDLQDAFVSIANELAALRLSK